MRIIAGERRGLRLAALGKGDTRAHLRPTSDRVRESLFSMLTGGRFGDAVAGAQVLDLFAGTGALGLEALSRGAKAAVFVETGRAALALLRENIAKTGYADRASLIRHDATRLGPAPIAATLVFLDPPYGTGLGLSALRAAAEAGWLAPGALVVIENNAPQPAPEGFALLDTRRYGDTHITLLRKDAP